MRNAHRLCGKAAVITGGSRGIGAAVARQFAREGATVAINHLGDAAAAGRTLAELHEATAAEDLDAMPHRAIEADVGDPTSVGRMMREAENAFGTFHILVNNAGIQAPTPGEDYDDVLLARILAVNLVGAASCARGALKHFLSRPGGGTIINTTSAHEIIPKPGYLAYAIGKGGLGSLTRTLALEFANRGIRVNAVGPGAVTTDLNAAWSGDPAARANVESHIPLGFAASAEDIAPIFAFLASEEARYITGQTIFACGGLTLFGDFKQNWAS